MTFISPKGLRLAHKKLLNEGQTCCCMFALGKLHELDVGAKVALTLHLYASMVQPAACCDGCEVWGPQRLLGS
jgi:hypothetical protein